jgi:hypothetical protein
MSTTADRLLRGGAAAGPDRWPQTADDSEQGRIGPEAFQGGMPARDVAESLGVSVPTLYRWVPAASR